MAMPAYPADVLARAAKIRLIGFGPVTALTRGAIVGPPLEIEETPFDGVA